MSSEIKWIKIVTDIFDDEKILLIESMPEADTIIVIWFKLLCLAGKLNRCGVIVLNGKIAYTEEMLAQVFRRPINTVRLALKTFEQFGMIEIINDTITIPNWEKHQSVDRMMEIKEYNRIKQRESRARKKALLQSGDSGDENVNDMSLTCQSSSISVSLSKENNLTANNDGDWNNLFDKEKKKKRKSKAFIKPTVEEIAAYCQERNNGIDPEAFFDKYESNGWVDKNGNPMKDWKATVRTWERWRKEKRNTDTQRVGKTVSAQQYAQREYTEAELLSVSDDLIAEAKAHRG
jgi:predicted phage replisome organizer